MLIYRKYYGTRLTLRLFVLFYAVMVAAGARRRGAVRPRRRHPDVARPTTIVATQFEWNYTTFLNIVFLVVFAGRCTGCTATGRGSAAGTATRSIRCAAMQVEKANAPAHLDVDGHDVWFCSDRCRERYEREPTSAS